MVNFSQHLRPAVLRRFAAQKGIMNMRKPLCLLLAVCVLCGAMLLPGCGSGRSGEAKTVKDCAIIHEPEFGGVYITKTIDEFNDLGYHYGDSVNIRFSNGYELLNQPYYSGYYTENGESLLVAYPGYDYIKACINNGEDLWEVAGLSEGDTAEIELSAYAVYLDIQMARDIHYTDVNEDYESDVVFSNFRSVSVTGIAPHCLYRGASPCDNQHNRAEYVNTLIDVAGVKCILDLADDDAKIQGYLENAELKVPAFRDLYAAGKVIPLALNTNFTSEGFRAKLADGLIQMSQQPGPYYVHCTEGKDRTGFVCLLLEALCGASYDEIRKDYMTTYDNYYGITEQSDPARYKTIVDHVLNPMVNLFAGEKALETADLKSGAEQYLADCGMTADQIEALRAALSE